MPKIIADTANGPVAFEVESGKKLVLALEDNGVDILHRCGGNARCTTCRVEVISGDYEGKKRKDRRTLAILAPTNKAASVLRLRGVPFLKGEGIDCVTAAPDWI